MSKSQNIPWKKHIINIESTNGGTIQAEINYWSKDYFIEVITPIAMTLYGPHIMYAIPVVYVLKDFEGEYSNYKQIPILEECKKRIIRHFVSGAI